MSLVKSLEVVRYEARLEAQWNAFIATAKNPSFLFHRGYMDYHSDRFADHSLLFLADGRLLACLPANRVDDTLRSHQGLTFGGLVMHRDMRLNEAAAVVIALLDHMAANGLRALDYRPMPHPYHLLPAEEDLIALQEAGAQHAPLRAAAVLHVGGTARFSYLRRRDVRRTSGGVEVRRSDAIGPFMRLCAAHLARRHAVRPVHSEAEMVRLADRFPDNIQLYVASHGGETICGIVIYRNVACTRMQYVGLSPAGEELGAEAAIIDHLLRHVLAAGSWFDLGTSDDPATGSLNGGLFRYKESLGARAVGQATYRLRLG